MADRICVFTCPDCGAAEFYLAYVPGPTPEEVAATPCLEIFGDDSKIHAQCARGCEFQTSVTNIELTLSPRRA